MGSLESTLFVVTARGGSKGIPHKNLREIHGKSLTEWALLVARKFMGAQVALSSDSDDILQIASRYHDVLAVKRPDLISHDAATDQEALQHALLHCEESLKVHFDTIVLLQPTAPSRTVDIIREALTTKVDDLASAVWTVDEVDLKLHARKQLMVTHRTLHLVIDTRKPLRRQDLTPTFVRNGECYALSREVVLNDPLLLGSNARMVVSEPGSVNIDSIEDLEKAQKLLKIGEDGILVKR